MIYRSSTEGGYGIGVSTDHVDASHADRIDVPDAKLLFRGHFACSGARLPRVCSSRQKLRNSYQEHRAPKPFGASWRAR
jgi:hypothetical protein